MGLSKDEEIKRAEKTRDIKAYKLEDEKKYVFISYCSKDWEVVLKEIVKNMQEKYGLRVYFDTNFEYDNKMWNENMREAIETSYCVAMLVFISKDYMKSPACLMEVLRARTVETENQHEGKELEIVPIIIDENENEIKLLKSRKSAVIDINRGDMVFYDIIEEVKRSSYMYEHAKLMNMLGPLEKDKREIREEKLSNIMAAFLEEAGYRREYIRKGRGDFYTKLYETIRKIDAEVFDASLVQASKKKIKTSQSKVKKSYQNLPSCQTNLKVTKTLNNTDVKYKICTFGSEFNIESGIKVTIEFGGRRYEGKTHSSTKGRIDGLSRLYKENQLGVGEVLSACYLHEQKTIKLKRI
ncbi:MAG: toll/interleukin-1 receptor domain-containing protein [Lachnospiraceae bacterium]|nr:toll/interleukin-1 receptor domain-containing protein [Lachnospiraceae bacterium]